MNVLYDCYVSTFQQKGGITRYFEQLIARLPEDINPRFLVKDGCPCSFAHHSRGCIITHRSFRLRPRRFSVGAGALYNRLRLAAERPALLHPTYYSLLGNRLWEEIKCPVVITVYDFIVRLFPETLANPAQEIAAQTAAIERADGLICISENTRRDLVRFYPEAASKAVVIPLGVELTSALASPFRLNFTNRFFVFVGGRTGYKNFPSVLRALAHLEGVDQEVGLAVVGGVPTSGELALIAELKLEQRVKFVGSLDDADLAAVYQQSIALVYSSRYEGFGLPVLEAMACSTAVIAVNISSIPEVAGTAAILVAPDNGEALSIAMAELLNENSVQRADRIQRGKAHAATFTWDETARRTVEFYHQTIEMVAERTLSAGQCMRIL